LKSLQIVGRKKSGKTSLIVRLVPLLQAHDLHVGTVKHSAHPHPLDREGSDSWLHRRAGAEATLAITAAGISLHTGIPEREDEVASLVGHYLGELDLVLIEGWAMHPGPKVEVVPADKQGTLREPRFLETGELIAVMAAPGLRPGPEAIAPWGAWHRGAERVPPPPAGVPAGTAAGHTPIPGFGWEDAEPLAQFILTWYRR
jgi:molybdopterin-guanine dinucleotide biosynthesis protein MobB